MKLKISGCLRIFLKKIGDLICKHPLFSLGFEYDVKVFPSNHVTNENGTGFVHIAPNHGQEDFDLGQVNSLGNDPTVNEKGVYEKTLIFLRVCMYLNLTRR